MKKLFFLSALAVSFMANSQTNTFPTTGNVGIGTTTPTEDLEVAGTILTEKLIIEPTGVFGLQVGQPLTGLSYRNFNFQNGSNNGVRFVMYNSASKRVFDLLSDDTQSYLAAFDKDGVNFFAAGINSTVGSFCSLPRAESRIVIGDFGGYLFNDGHKFVVKDGSAMIEGNVLTNSNVGIGTSSFIDGSDTYRLSVDGRVRAHAVKVYTDWADFVFEEDYKLPTLEEVEAHIKLNGHLKDIPSAEDVEKNGIELGEMNKLLLQKIEELTLYTIELKKEVDILKSKME